MNTLLAETRSVLVSLARFLSRCWPKEHSQLGQSLPPPLPEPLQITPEGVTRSLAWCGEIITANVDEVMRMTSEHVVKFVSGNATLVIIDMRRLRFIDSSGAEMMVRLKKQGCFLRAEILFTNPTPSVKNVLTLCGVDQFLLAGGQ
jgi:anti-anti-sigma factor